MSGIRSARSGITLLELLIAGAILTTLLVVLGQLFAASYRSYTVTETVSEERQIVQAAVELIRYELSLSGYRCTDNDAFSRSFAQTPLSVVDGTAGPGGQLNQSITVRYFEDRFTDDPCDDVVVATFYVEDGVLWRQVDAEDATVVVEGVDALSVDAWLERTNVWFVNPTRPPNDRLVGAKLRLTFTAGGVEVFTVGFRNSQCASAASCS